MSSDRDPAGRRLPKWRADELFKKMAESYVPLPSSEGEGQQKTLQPTPVDAPPDPYAGPVWPHWYARSAEEEREKEEVGTRALVLAFACIFILSTISVYLGSGITILASLTLVPALFVRFAGRYAKAYSACNLLSWGGYVGYVTVLFLMV